MKRKIFLAVFLFGMISVFHSKSLLKSSENVCVLYEDMHNILVRVRVLSSLDNMDEYIYPPSMVLSNEFFIPDGWRIVCFSIDGDMIYLALVKWRDTEYPVIREH